MRKKRKGKAVQKLEDRDSFALLSNKKTITLDTGEIISEIEWKRRFDDEWYNADRNGSFEIIDSEEGKKEAHRNNNNNKRDLFNVAEKMMRIEEYDPDQKAFMQDASDSWEWNDAYKIAGADGAKRTIYAQAHRDIEQGDIDSALNKFYIKMIELKNLIRKEKRTDR